MRFLAHRQEKIHVYVQIAAQRFNAALLKALYPYSRRLQIAEN